MYFPETFIFVEKRAVQYMYACDTRPLPGNVFPFLWQAYENGEKVGMVTMCEKENNTSQWWWRDRNMTVDLCHQGGHNVLSTSRIVVGGEDYFCTDPKKRDRYDTCVNRYPTKRFVPLTKSIHTIKLEKAEFATTGTTRRSRQTFQSSSESSSGKPWLCALREQHTYMITKTSTCIIIVFE